MIFEMFSVFFYYLSFFSFLGFFSNALLLMDVVILVISINNRKVILFKVSSNQKSFYVNFVEFKQILVFIYFFFQLNRLVFLVYIHKNFLDNFIASPCTMPLFNLLVWQGWSWRSGSCGRWTWKLCWSGIGCSIGISQCLTIEYWVSYWLGSKFESSREEVIFKIC